MRSWTLEKGHAEILPCLPRPIHYTFDTTTAVLCFSKCIPEALIFKLQAISMRSALLEIQVAGYTKVQKLNVTLRMGIWMEAIEKHWTTFSRSYLQACWHLH